MSKIDTARHKAVALVECALEKKAVHPVILDVRKQTNLCDFFVIVSGESTVQVRAIYDHIVETAKTRAIGIAHREDDESNRWLLVDCDDVIVHIFLEEERKYYDLEYLWKKAKKVVLSRGKKKPAVKRKKTSKKR